MMTKNELRAYYRHLRTQLTPSEETDLNFGLLDNFKRLEWQNVKFCHVFLPILKFHEPNTMLLISFLQEKFPTVQIVISKSNLQSNVMSHYLYDDKLALANNQWGILEPVEGIYVDEKSIDMVLVPLLISDKVGNRIGYGKGYYDRFLSLCRSDVKKVGLSFFEPIAIIEDIDPHDIPLDVCVTPKGIYYY
jgi:5-formyltetrahydrofolate cyclo-ligase